MGQDSKTLEHAILMDRREALRLSFVGGLALALFPSEAEATPGPCRPRKGYTLFEDIRGHADPNALVGQVAPAFYQKDINPRSRTYHKFIGPQDYKGNIVVLNLWASYCLPCLDELPRLQKISQAYNDITILGLIAGEDGVDPDVDQIGALTKITFPILGAEGKSPLNVRACQDSEKTSAAYFDHQKGKRADWMGLMISEQLYGFNQLPTTFIIDRQHIVREVQRGTLNAQEWEDKLKPYI